jgi:CspA family cold shock protein
MTNARRRERPPGAVTTAATTGAIDMVTGKVKFFNYEKGFGFIAPDNGGKDSFVHISAVERSGVGELKEGDKVSYEIETQRGKPAATNLKRVA